MQQRDPTQSRKGAKKKSIFATLAASREIPWRFGVRQITPAIGLDTYCVRGNKCAGDSV
jgi:hypothetical protein